MAHETAIKIKRKKLRKDIIQENLTGWLFLSVNLVGYLMFRLLPILLSLILSFCDWNMISGLDGIKFTGLKNYVDLFSDTVFLKSLQNTLIFVVVFVPVSVVLSLFLAVIINDKIYLKNFVRMSFYIPYIASMVALSVIWSVLYLPSYGPINSFLMSIGISSPPGWLTSENWALPSIIIFSVWQILGYNAIILLAGLQDVPKSMYESANIDGANGFAKFTKITIPMLSPALFFVVVISIINSFQVFTQVNIMTQGGPGTSTTVLVYYIYKTAFAFNNIGYANTIGWVLFILVFAFTVLQLKFSKTDTN